MKIDLNKWKNIHNISYPNKNNSKNPPWDIKKPDENLKWVFDSFNLKIGSALELGCGVGNDSIYLNEKGFKVDAIDINQSFINQAKTTNKEINFICGDIFSDIPPKKYDFIYDRGFIHNLPYVIFFKTFQLLYNKIKTDGILVVITGHPSPKYSKYVIPPPIPIYEMVLGFKEYFNIKLIKEIKYELGKDYDDNLGVLYVLKKKTNG